MTKMKTLGRWLLASIAVAACGDAEKSSAPGGREDSGLNHDGESAPGPNIEPSSNTVAYGRYFFDIDNVNSPEQWASHWWINIHQGNHLAQARAVKAANPTAVVNYVYATPAGHRPGDPEGYTTSILPSTCKDEWILRDSNGAKIQRDNGTDWELDFGNVDYQKESAQYLVAKAVNEGWDGIFLDEINVNPMYGFPTRPAKYPDDASWDVAVKAYVDYVTSELHRVGKRVSINLGGDDDWAKSMAAAVDQTMVEFFFALHPALGLGEAATEENDYWAPQLRWALTLENTSPQPFFHASTTDPRYIDYALGAYLLVTKGRGVFAASREYGDNSDAHAYTPAMDRARRLGAPTGDYTMSDGIYRRNFVNGYVRVNPSSSPRSGLAGSTSEIVTNDAAAALR